MSAECIDLNKIDLDPKYHTRKELDTRKVGKYAKLLQGKEPSTPPPIILCHKEGVYWIVDGYHRTHAHIKAGLETIQAIVFEGEPREAFLRGLAYDNPLTSKNPKDRESNLLKLLADPEWSRFSTRKLSDLTGIGRNVINRHRKDKGPRVGADGKARKATKERKPLLETSSKSLNQGGKSTGTAVPVDGAPSQAQELGSLLETSSKSLNQGGKSGGMVMPPEALTEIDLGKIHNLRIQYMAGDGVVTKMWDFEAKEWVVPPIEEIEDGEAATKAMNEPSVPFSESLFSEVSCDTIPKGDIVLSLSGINPDQIDSARVQYRVGDDLVTKVWDKGSWVDPPPDRQNRADLARQLIETKMGTKEPKEHDLSFLTPGLLARVASELGSRSSQPWVPGLLEKLTHHEDLIVKEAAEEALVAFRESPQEEPLPEEWVDPLRRLTKVDKRAEITNLFNKLVTKLEASG